MLELRLVVASSGAEQALPVIGECGRRDISAQYNRAINNLETFLCNKGLFLCKTFTFLCNRLTFLSNKLTFHCICLKTERNSCLITFI